MMNNILLVAAAGVGSRFGSDTPKQYEEIEGVSVLEHCLAKAKELGIFSKIIVGVQDLSLVADIKRDANTSFVKGGDTRTKTIANLLAEVKNEEEKEKREGKGEEILVWIHDCVRPLFREDMEKLVLELDSLGEMEGLTLSAKIVDTLARESQEAKGYLGTIVPREHLVRIFTPQIFRINEIIRVMKNIGEKNFTDETSMFTAFGGKVRLVEGNPNNMKITFKDDLKFCRDW